MNDRRVVLDRPQADAFATDPVSFTSAGELQATSYPRSIGWLSVQDPYGVRNDEVHLRRDVSARAELGCPTLRASSRSAPQLN